jgi:hypothetical protein
MGDEKSDRGFKIAIDEEIARFETLQRQKEEDREAAEKQLQDARAKAMKVRDDIIIPLLNQLRDDFAAEAKLLPAWEVRTEEHIDEFFGTAATPTVDASGAAVGYYVIKAKVSLAEHGVLLDSSVECSYFDPNSASADQGAEVHKENTPAILLTFDTEWSKNQMYSMAGKLSKHPPFDVQRSREWFQKQLTECAKKCVRARLERAIRNNTDAGRVS